jgi:hypothetical protein
MYETSYLAIAGDPRQTLPSLHQSMLHHDLKKPFHRVLLNRAKRLLFHTWPNGDR